MGVISVRVNDDEMSVLENASKMYTGGISSMIKKIVFERLEDEYDLSVAKEYLQEKKAGTYKTKPVEEVCKDLGIDWDSL